MTIYYNELTRTLVTKSPLEALSRTDRLTLFEDIAYDAYRDSLLEHEPFGDKEREVLDQAIKIVQQWSERKRRAPEL